MEVGSSVRPSVAFSKRKLWCCLNFLNFSKILAGDGPEENLATARVKAQKQSVSSLMFDPIVTNHADEPRCFALPSFSRLF